MIFKYGLEINLDNNKRKNHSNGEELEQKIIFYQKARLWLFFNLQQVHDPSCSAVSVD